MIRKLFPELIQSSTASFWSIPQTPWGVAQMSSFALTLDEVTLQAAKRGALPPHPCLFLSLPSSQPPFIVLPLILTLEASWQEIKY